MRNLSLLLVLTLFLADPARALTADELVAKNVEARGGLEKIRAISSLKLEGKLRYTGGESSTELGYAAFYKRGGKFRSEASMQGLTAVKAYDGQDAWQVEPFYGRTEAERLTQDRTRALADQADLEGPLVDYRAKGHRVEYLGTEDVDGTEAHRLKVSLKDGDVLDVYLDPDYFLEIRVVLHTRERGVEQVTETDLSEYARVEGVYFPFSLETGSQHGSKYQKISIQKAEANLPIEDGMFAFPVGGK